MSESNKQAKKVFDFAVKAGEAMLKNGAETYRVEDTMLRILNTTGCDTCETFVTPTGIFATLDNINMDTITRIKRVENRSIHLYRVSLVNQLSREFCTKHINIDDALIRIKDIKDQPSYPFGIMIAAAGIASAAFSLIFDGSLGDALGALIIGFIVAIIHMGMKRAKVARFFTDVICGGLIGILGLVLFEGIGLGVHFSAIIAGAIMPFVPGVAITNAIFDTIQGNLLSGMSRAVEAFIVATSIAIGIGSILKLYGMLFGGVFI